MKHTLFITGAAGYIGSMLCDIYDAREDVEQIIALDTEPRPEELRTKQKIVWVQANTSEDTWQRVVRRYAPDIVIHTAWQIRELYKRKADLAKWNLNGSENVFDFAFSEPTVQKLIHFSTIASYGADKTNSLDRRFKESDALRKSDYLYAEQKRVAEEIIAERYGSALTKGKDIQVAILRPASITGPRGRYMRVRFGLQSALRGQRQATVAHRAVTRLLSFVPVTPKWCRQFVHEDDIANAVSHIAFGNAKFHYEAFNLCPPGEVMTGGAMAKAVGKRAILVPPLLLRVLFATMWHASRGRIPTSGGGWKCYSYPIPVDGTKITNQLGYRYQHSSTNSFVNLVGRYSSCVPSEQRSPWDKRSSEEMLLSAQLSLHPAE